MAKYDVIVIGSGLGGLTVAFGLTKKGFKVAIVEEDKFGGIVANYGSTRKKELVTFAELKLATERLAEKGTVNELFPNWQEAMQSIDALEDVQSDNHKEALKKAGIDPIIGAAQFVDEHHINVKGTIYEAEKFILATGAKSRELQVAGSEHFKYSADFLTQKELPKNITIVGAGIIAFAFMTIAEAFGVKVRVLQHDDRALADFDSELVKKLIELNTKRGIKYHFDEQLLSIQKNQNNYLITTSTGDSYETDAVYCVAGRVPNIGDLNLEALGIECSNHGIKVDDYLTTNLANIYACGDCTSTVVPKLATYAVYQADYLVEHLSGDGLQPIDYPLPAMSTFSQPKLAQAGMSIAEAQTKQALYRIERIDMTSWLAYKRTNDETAILKVIYANSDDRIVGVTSISNQADMLINYFTMALHAGWKKSDLKKIIFAYPSLANDVLRAFH